MLVRPETFGPYYVCAFPCSWTAYHLWARLYTVKMQDTTVPAVKTWTRKRVLLLQAYRMKGAGPFEGCGGLCDCIAPPKRLGFCVGCVLQAGSYTASSELTVHEYYIRSAVWICVSIGPRCLLTTLAPNDVYTRRTAQRTFRRYILNIYSTDILTEYFKHAAHSPFFPLQDAVYFIMLTFLLSVIFTF